MKRKPTERPQEIHFGHKEAERMKRKHSEVAETTHGRYDEAKRVQEALVRTKTASRDGDHPTAIATCSAVCSIIYRAPYRTHISLP